jgi:sugar lactone lactonase YvrE
MTVNAAITRYDQILDKTLVEEDSFSSALQIKLDQTNRTTAVRMLSSGKTLSLRYRAAGKESWNGVTEKQMYFYFLMKFCVMCIFISQNILSVSSRHSRIKPDPSANVSISAASVTEYHNSLQHTIWSISVDCTDLTPSITPLSGIGIITTVAGTGLKTYSGDGGQATAASLNYPYGVTVDAAGNMYITDTLNNRIRKVLRSSGVITTIAGDGTLSYGGDGGPATSAQLRSPFGVAVATSGDIYIADSSNWRVRLVENSTGIITSVAGNGVSGYSGDGGQATLAAINAPTSIALDSDGNIYIATPFDDRVRKVIKNTKIITTVAGDGTSGFSGDGGLATSARLFRPYGVALDKSGNLYIADNTNNCIRLVTKSTGIITTIAGDGTTGYSGDGGPATSARLSSPFEVSVDASGNVYISDTYNHRVRMVTKSTGIISTLGGDGMPAYSGDGGISTSAQFFNPRGIAVDASGSLFIADTSNSRLRVITPDAPIVVSGKTLSS